MAVGVTVGVFVGVPVRVGVAVGECVCVGVIVGVAVDVGVGVGASVHGMGAASVSKQESTRSLPSPPAISRTIAPTSDKFAAPSVAAVSALNGIFTVSMSSVRSSLAVPIERFLPAGSARS